jgi:hypothetical protein
MRSMSERVVLRTNIFIEQPPPTAAGGARPHRAMGMALPEEEDGVA